MKLLVKTLGGGRGFEIEVETSDSIMAVKTKIEDLMGAEKYSCAQQTIVCDKKVLTDDDSTVLENEITEESVLVVMSKPAAPPSTAPSSSHLDFVSQKLAIKTANGRRFEVSVQPSDKIMVVKKIIEDSEGKDKYPCGQQVLIHNGKVLKDETTLLENGVTEGVVLIYRVNERQALENQEEEELWSSKSSDSESESQDWTYEEFCTSLQLVVLDESKRGQREGYEFVDESTNQPPQLVNPFHLFSLAFNNGNVTL